MNSGSGGRERVHALIEENKRLAKETTLKMKRMQSMKSADVREQQARRVAQSKLAQDFQVWVQKFQEVSTLDLNKERNERDQYRQEQQRNAATTTTTTPQKGHGAFPGLGPRYEEQQQQEGGWGQQQHQQPSQQQQRGGGYQQLQEQQEDDGLDVTEQLIRERNREIREIETAVVEVGQIFQDLAAMVNEQGVMVDNIEANISSSVAATDEGVRELESAEEYQIKARKKCIIITIILVVVAAVVVLAVLGALHII